MRRPKSNFCTPEYLDLAPCKRELTKYTRRCTIFFRTSSCSCAELSLSGPELAGAAPCLSLDSLAGGADSSSASLSATNAALTTWLVAARYSSNFSCGLGATSIGVEDRYLFKSCSAASAFGVHFIGPAFFKILKNGRARSADLEINLLRAATQPASFRTSLTRAGASICSMALILSGLASIPRWDTKNPRSLPEGTPNTHFSGLSLRLILRKFAKVSSKSWTRVALSLLLTTISSM